MNAPDTLGQRLDRLGRGIAGRHELGFPWAAPFGVLLEHLGELPSPGGPRFRRQEGRVERLAAPKVPAPPTVSAGHALPSDVSLRLGRIVGDGVRAMRVHDDEAADARARAHRADAVTVGSDVYFRAGKLKPREPRGFALLAHEATHVVERMRPGASWRRSTTGGAGEEERLALAREAQALAPQPIQPMPPMPQMTVPSEVHIGHAEHVTAATASGHSIARPMTAATDRDVPAPGNGRANAPVDLDALKALLLRDLIGQLRDEFERGG